MGWSIGFDEGWNRWVGYGVPAYCDHEDCTAEINRGIGYVCGSEPYGGEHGCGLHFCSSHLFLPYPSYIQLCERCDTGKQPFIKSDEHPIWLEHLLNDPSWNQWRIENPDEVSKLNDLIGEKV